jgi:hypothetical protein
MYYETEISKVWRDLFFLCFLEGRNELECNSQGLYIILFEHH